MTDFDSNEKPSVFISYSHDSEEHRTWVRGLSNRLRGSGINSWIDQYDETTSQSDWQLWMSNMVEQADSVIIVCSERYYNSVMGKMPLKSGLGARWEGAIIRQYVYQDPENAAKFIPIVKRQEDAVYIPDGLRGHTFFKLMDAFDDLVLRLQNRRKYIPAPLKKVTDLPEFPDFEVKLYLHNKANFDCIDIAWETSDINLYHCLKHGGKNQQWIFKSDKNNSAYVIVSALTSKVLDVNGHSSEPGTNIIQWDYHGGDNQWWLLDEQTDGSHKIRSKESDLCLTLYNWETGNGKLIQAIDTDDDNQRWWIKVVSQRSA